MQFTGARSKQLKITTTTKKAKKKKKKERNRVNEAIWKIAAAATVS